MPSTRSGGGASPESGEEGGTAQLLEEAAAELSSEIAARKAAEERLADGGKSWVRMLVLGNVWGTVVRQVRFLVWCDT